MSLLIAWYLLEEFDYPFPSSFVHTALGGGERLTVPSPETSRVFGGAPHGPQLDSHRINEYKQSINQCHSRLFGVFWARQDSNHMYILNNTHMKRIYWSFFLPSPFYSSNDFHTKGNNLFNILSQQQMSCLILAGSVSQILVL